MSSNISRDSNETSEYDLALKYLEKSIKVMCEIGDKVDEISTLSYLSNRPKMLTCPKKRRIISFQFNEMFISEL